MSQGRRRRLARLGLRRFLLVAALLSAVAAVTAPAGAQVDDGPTPGPRPTVFESTANAQAVSLLVDRDALLPVPQALYFIAVEALTTYDTDLQRARASLFFPGNGGIQGPNLACGTFGGQFPPEFQPIIDACLRYDYPLSVIADASQSDKNTLGAVQLGSDTDMVSADAVGARVHAAEDSSSGYAAMQDLRVLGLPVFGPTPIPAPGFESDGSIVSVGNAVSRTRQTIAEDGALVGEAETVLSGIKIAGGLITINELRSVSSIRDGASGPRTAVADLIVGGVTVAGQPAQITEDGLVISDTGSGPLHQQLVAALNAIVQSLGIRITMLESIEMPDDPERDRAVASAGGLLVEFATEAQGLPGIPGPTGEIDPNGIYRGSVQLGFTAVSGSAASFGDDGLPEELDETFAATGSDDFFVGDTGGDFGVEPGGTVRRPGKAPEVALGGGDGTRIVRRVTDTFGGRIGLVYLAFVLAVLALCVTPRLIFPARLPGPRS